MLFNNQIQIRISFVRIFLAFSLLFLLSSCDGDVNEDLDDILFYDPQVYEPIDNTGNTNEGSILFSEGFESGWGDWRTEHSSIKTQTGNWGAQAPDGEWGITDAYQRSGSHSAFVVTGEKNHFAPISEIIQKGILNSEIKDLGVSFYYQIHCDGSFGNPPKFIFSVGTSFHRDNQIKLFIGSNVTDQSKNTWIEVSKLVDKDVFKAGKIYIGFSSSTDSSTNTSHCVYYLDDIKVFYID